MVSRSPTDWDDVSSPAVTSGIQGELEEQSSRLSESFRLSASSEHGLQRFWPIPFYALAYAAHKRYRLSRPRASRLPRLTCLGLGETYGALALGHAADLEASRLYERMVRERDADRLSVVLYADTMRRVWCEFLREARAARDRDGKHAHIWVDITRPGVLDPPGGRYGWDLSVLIEALHPDGSFPLWRLRGVWSDAPSRELASLWLHRPVRTLGLGSRDARALVWFVAEQMHTERYYHHPVFITGHLAHARTYEGQLPLWFAASTLARGCLLWAGAAGPGWLVSAAEVLQRTVFHAWVVRTLWGEYAHWHALRGLEDPGRARAVVVSAMGELAGKVEKLVRGEDGRGPGGSRVEDGDA